MKVLLIEDDLKISKAIRLGLEQEKYIVETAYDGQLGYELATNYSFDVIIIDLMLPKIDGLRLCSAIREKNIQTPILILTAKSDLDDKLKGFNCGADDYLVKPFDFEELLARLKSLTRRRDKPIKKIIKIGDLQINTETYEVSRNNKRIKLTKKEYLILELLARYKGQIISKDKIIDNIWHFSDDIMPNTVEVYIKYLRRKIDQPFDKSKKLIKTVRGYGYKIDDKT
ncbi:MAG: DNA-binding response regulator [Patescibacteria group bacterium]|nr:MAG: DNA-binding response regulator [Patescibacteria group bacterium]